MARGLPPALHDAARSLASGMALRTRSGRNAALAGHFYAPVVHMVQLPDGVRVRIDAEDAAIIERLLVPAPVEVESPWMRIDFDGDAVLGAGFKDFVDVDLISRSAGELAPGRWPIIVVWEFSMALKILPVCSFLDILKRL